MGVHRTRHVRGNEESCGITPTQTLPHPGGGLPDAIPLVSRLAALSVVGAVPIIPGMMAPIPRVTRR